MNESELKAEIERLNADLDVLSAGLADANCVITRQEREIEALKAEIESMHFESVHQYP